MTRTLLNLVAFNACWLATVLGAANGMPWLGPIAVLWFAAIHLSFARMPIAEAWLFAAAMMLGYALDSVLVLSGVLSFPDHAVMLWPSTAWMVSLWGNLALTLHGCLAWMRGRYLVGVLFGGAGGPMAYWAGAGFGAVQLDQGTTLSLAMVAVEWAIAMPVLLWLADRLDRASGEAGDEGAAA